jgi:hypothetical protein
MLSVRKTIRLVCWPDPLLQERIEEVGFFFDQIHRSWIRFCEEDEVASISEWLKRHRLSWQVLPANGRAEVKRHPRLSDELVLKNGGSATVCALCAATGVACRQWIEGDDTDSTDYPHAARFYLCGKCVQKRMSPHPRLYSNVEESL